MEANTESNTSQTFAQMTVSKESYSNVKNIEPTDTPFTIITVEQDGEEKSFLAIGNTRCSELTTKDELLEILENKSWGLITTLIIHLIKNQNIL